MRLNREIKKQETEKPNVHKELPKDMIPPEINSRPIVGL